MMHDWGWDLGWGSGMFFGPLFMIAGPVIFIVLLVWLVRALTRKPDTGSTQARSAREILDERFAKGEIDRDDYDARRKALGA